MASSTERLKGISIQLDLDLTKLEKSVSKINKIASTLQGEFTRINKNLKINPDAFELLDLKEKNLIETQQTLTKLLRGYYIELEKLEEEGKGIDDMRWRAVSLAINETNKKLQNTEAELKKLKDYAIDMHIAEYTDKLNKLQGQLDRVNNILDKTPKSVNAIKTKTELLTEKQKTLNSLLAQYEMKIDSLENAEIIDQNKLRDAQIKVQEIKQNLEEVSKELYDISMLKITQPLDDFAEKAQKVSDIFKGIADATRILSTTALAGLTGTTKAAIDYEDAFASVKKTVEADKETLDALRESIIEMSKEIPSSANDIAEVVALAGQLGVGAEDVLEFSRAMIDLGNSTNMSSASAAETIAKFFNITGGDLKEVQNFSSALVELGNNAATTETDIMELAYRLAGAGTAIGFTQPEILALSTALSSAGLKAEAAGGSISSLLQAIEAEVKSTDLKDANKDLKMWGDLVGMSGEQFKKAWSKDTYNTFLKITEAIANSNDENDDLILKLNQIGASTIRQSDSMSRLVLNYDNLVLYTEMANTAFEKGTALQNEAAKRYETMKSQLTVLKNNLMAIGITIGNAVMPYITQFLQKVNQVIPKIAEWINKNSDLVVKTLAIVATISPLSKGASLITGWAGKIAKGISTILKSKFAFKVAEFAKGGLPALTKAVTTIMSHLNPLTLLITAVGAALIYAYTHNEEFRNEINTLVQTIISKLSPIIKDVIEIFKTLWQFLKDFLTPIFNRLGDLFKNYFVPIVMNVVGIVGNLTSAFITLIKWVWDTLYPILQTVINFVRLTFIPIWNLLIGAVGNLIQFVLDLIATITGLWNAFKTTMLYTGIQTFFSACAEAVEGFRSKLESVIGWLSNAIEKVKSFFGLNSEAQSAYNETASRYSSGGGGSGGGGVIRNYGGVNVTVNAANNRTASSVVNEIESRIANNMNRREVVFG